MMLRISFLSVVLRRSSYVGSRPLAVESAVGLSVTPIVGDNSETFKKTSLVNIVEIVGPLGRVRFPTIDGLCISKEDCSEDEYIVKVSRDSEIDLRKSLTKFQKKFIMSMWGTTRKMIENAVVGVTLGHRASIKLVGVGYKTRIENSSVFLKVGHSHQIQLAIPAGIEVQSTSSTGLVVSGIDKRDVNLFAARVRSVRKPEPYKGKGIFVNNETIRLKEVKKK